MTEELYNIEPPDTTLHDHETESNFQALRKSLRATQRQRFQVPRKPLPSSASQRPRLWKKPSWFYEPLVDPSSDQYSLYELHELDELYEKRHAKKHPSVKPAGLHSQDHGKAAWSTLIAAVSSDAILSAFPLSYGVFQEHYYQIYNQNSPWIGLLINGIEFMGSPIITYVCQRTRIAPHFFVWVGFSLCLTGMFVSAYCTSLSALIVTQGLIYGFGILLFETPCLIILNSWFNERRGIANGLVFASADLAGLAWTFLASSLLRKRSFKTAILILTAIIFVIGFPSIFILRLHPGDTNFGPKSRRKPQETDRDNHSAASTVAVEPDRAIPNPSTSFIQTKARQRFSKCLSFYNFLICDTLQGLAYYLPFIYLPSFATSLGYSSSQGTLALALANLAQIVGEVGFGALSDRLNSYLLIMFSTLPAALTVFLLWAFSSESLGILIAFAMLFGAFGSGFIALLARIGMIFGERDSQMVYSFMLFGRGLSSLISGPISQALVKPKSEAEMSQASFSYGGPAEYENIVFFVGACMAASALVAVAGTLKSLITVQEQLDQADVLD